MNTFARKSALFGLVALLVACSQSRPAVPAQTVMSSGQLTISRPAPAVDRAALPAVFALMPQSPKHTGTWLSIEKGSKLVHLMEGDKELAVSSAEGAASLPAGVFQLLHKQRTALWYAPDSYFTSRGQPLPPKNDKSRYRRGALGEFALFFDKSIPIHNAPVWSSDVGGLRLPENDISRIYYSLEVGAPIEVR